jgi:hypothetical protein
MTKMATAMSQLLDHPAQAPDLRKLKCEVCSSDHCRHFDEELDHVDHQNSPQARVRGKDDVEEADRQKRLPSLQAEQDGGDLACRQIHRCHDHTVKKEPQIDRSEPANKPGRFAGITNLVELQVRHHP